MTKEQHSLDTATILHLTVPTNKQKSSKKILTVWIKMIPSAAVSSYATFITVDEFEIGNL